MSGVKYIGPIFDGSGYAEAARNYVLAIHKQGYPITLAPITFEQARPDLGKDGEILKSLVNAHIPYDKVIVHSTPDLWRQFTHFEQNKKIIGCTVWETDSLPAPWTLACNRVDEVWVPCEWNLEVFRQSGVQIPLIKIPHAIDAPNLEDIQSFNLEGVSPDTFVFYSIFQWQERKNPYALLASYSAAFTGVNDVILVLKTYKHNQGGDKEDIKKLVVDFRKYLTLDHHPKLFLMVDNMSRQDMLSLHKRGDCFVLLQRSEGWGLPHFEAAAMGKPVITPAYGGQTEFLREENSYLVDYQLTPVTGMPWSPYYRADQFWCEPNLKTAIDQMRRVYNNRTEAAARGDKAREVIKSNFSLEAVGNLIIERLRHLDQGV